jgi:hypothetical protein
MLVLLLLSTSAVGADGLSVGIVGGGPSGASFAGRLREAFGSAAEITVFEAKGHLGGQAETVTTDGVVQDKGTRYMLKNAGRSVRYDEVTTFLRRHAGQGKGFTPYAPLGAPGFFNGTGAAAGFFETEGWQERVPAVCPAGGRLREGRARLPVLTCRVQCGCELLQFASQRARLSGWRSQRAALRPIR